MAGRFPAGRYVLSIGARDLAGNETPAAKRKHVTVVLRYIEVTPERTAVRVSRPFRVHVETASKRYTWRLGKRHGSRRGKTLRLRAPSQPGHVPARRDRERARRDRGRAGAQVIGLAEIAGPIACIGLAVLLLARTRRSRIAGLCYAGVGTVLLAVSLAPSNAAEVAAAVVGVIVFGPLLAWLFRREPWLVAYGTLAFIPFRIGFLGHSLLVPLYAVALGAAGPAAVAARGRGRADARAQHRVVAARALPRLDRALGLVERRRACGRGRPARVLCPVHDPRRLDRAPPVAAVARPDPLRRARGHGARLRLRGLLPVRDEDDLPEREAEPEQHLRRHLPGQLRLLRPVDLRALPRRRDDRDRCPDRPRLAVAARRPGGARVPGGRVARAPHLVLPVELRRAARGRVRADRGGLALEVAVRARRPSSSSRPRSPWPSRS